MRLISRRGKSKAKNNLTAANVSDHDERITATEETQKKGVNQKNKLPFRSHTKKKDPKDPGTQSKSTLKSSMKRMRHTLIPKKIRKSVSRRFSLRSNRSGIDSASVVSFQSNADDAYSTTSAPIGFYAPSSPSSTAHSTPPPVRLNTYISTSGGGADDSARRPGSDGSGASEKSVFSSLDRGTLSPTLSPTVKLITDEPAVCTFDFRAIPDLSLADGSCSASPLRWSTDASTQKAFGSRETPAIPSSVQVSIEDDHFGIMDRSPLRRSIVQDSIEDDHFGIMDHLPLRRSTHQELLSAFTQVKKVSDDDDDENDPQEIPFTPMSTALLPVMEVEPDTTQSLDHISTTDRDDDSCLSHDGSDLDSQASSVFVAKDDTHSATSGTSSSDCVPVDRIEFRETVSCAAVEASVGGAATDSSMLWTDASVGKEDGVGGAVHIDIDREQLGETLSRLAVRVSVECPDIDQEDLEETISRLAAKARMEEETFKRHDLLLDAPFLPVEDYSLDLDLKEGSGTQLTWFQNLLVCCNGGNEAYKPGVIGGR